MPTHEMKTRMKLEGEQEFKRAMADAASAIKTLNAEQKLAEAQYEATGDAQQYAADQARILKEKIEEQKKAVNAAEEAMKKLTENGFDKNSKQMREWRQKLSTSQARLIGFQTQLKNVQDEFDKTDEKANGSDLANGINFANTIEAIDGITTAIEKVIKFAAKAAKALWDMGVDAGKWADEISTAANEAGLDPETYQSWQYASRFIDTSVDDIVKSWRDLDKHLNADKTGDDFRQFAEKLNKLGVGSIDKVTRKVKDGRTAFWEVIDALHAMGSETAWASSAMDIFGNDWRKLNPLITEGSRAYMNMAKEGMSVAVVSNENVKALAGVDDEVNKFQASFDKLKYDTLAELAPTFQKTAEALNLAVTAMDQFVQSEEGQAALSSLNAALSGLIDSFLGEDNGKTTFASIVNTATEAVTQFTGALSWIQENGNAVAGIILSMVGAWAGLKVVKGAMEMFQIGKAGVNGAKNLFGGGKNLLSRLFGSKSASAESLDDVAKSFSDTAERFNDTADAFDAAADSAKKSAEAAKSSSEAAKSASASASSASEAAKGSSDAASSASGAASSSSEAAKGSATAAESASESAGSNAEAAGKSAEAATSSKEGAASSENAAATSKEAAKGSASAAKSASESAESTAEAAGKSAEAATSSKEGAASSENAAATSKEAAKGSASAAKSASESAESTAEAAGKSAEAATSSKEGAASSKEAADSSADAAANSKDAAKGSKEAAKASAGASWESAKSSVYSAIAAESSKTAAAASKDAALLSAGAAWESAKAAATSIEAAASSAASAAESALGAAVSRTLLEEQLAGAAAARTLAEAAAARAIASANAAALTAGGSAGVSLLNGAGQALLGSGGTPPLALPPASSSPSVPSFTPTVGAGVASASEILGGVAIMAGFTYAIDKAVEARRGDQSKLVGTAEHLAAATENDKALKEAFEEYVNTQRAMEESEIAYYSGKMDPQELEEVIKKANEASEAFLAMKDSEKVLDAYNAWRDEHAINFFDWILPDNWEELGLGATDGLSSGVEKGLPDVETAGASIADTLTGATMDALDEHSPSKVMETIGGNAAVGLANGIYDRGDEAIRAAQWLADSVTNIMADALQIHSPSKVFEEMGEFTALGYAQGVERSASAVERAVSRMASAATRPASSPVYMMAGAPAARSAGSSADMFHVTIAVDGEDLADMMVPMINGKIGAIINSTRR